MKTTFYLALDDSERSIIIHFFNSLLNRLIEQAVDDILAKVISAKKFKIIYEDWIMIGKLNVRCENQGDYSLPCIKNQTEKWLTYRRVGKSS